MSEKEIHCWNCRLLKKKREHYYSDYFGKGGPHGAKWSEWKWRMPMAFCQHKSCFEVKDGMRTRMRGQAQLNKDHDCLYYKEKWITKWRIYRTQKNI